mgnify:CR=1 FL=1
MTNAATAGGPVTFLNRTYEETIELLLEARGYLAGDEPQDRARMPACDRLLLALETTRLTTMLAHMVAWLLLQRAVAAGEIPREAAASPEHRLGGRELCTELTGAGDNRLPLRLRTLMLRGQRLYARLSRLDEMILRDVGGPAG